MRWSMPCLTESVTTPAHTRSLNHQASLSLHSRGSAQAQTLHMKNRTCARRSRTSSASIVSPGGVINKKLHTLLHRMPMHAPSPLETTACVTQILRASFISLPPHLCPAAALLCCLFACDIAMGRALRGQPTPKGPAPCSAATASAPPLFLSSSVCDRFLHVLFVLLRSARVSAPACFCSRPIRRAPPPRRS